MNFYIHLPLTSTYPVIQPSRHTSHSRTLIDNIVSNVITEENSVLNKYAPLKRVNKYKLKLKKKTLDYFWQSKINLH